MQTIKNGCAGTKKILSLVHQIETTTTMASPKGVDVVGCDKHSNGRHCTAHSVCGHYVQVDDKLYCKWGVQRPDTDEDDGGNDGNNVNNEACVEVHKLGTDGCITCHVGYLQRRIVKASRDATGNKDGGKTYDGMWLTVVTDLRLSDSAGDRK